MAGGKDKQGNMAKGPGGKVGAHVQSGSDSGSDDNADEVLRLAQEALEAAKVKAAEALAAKLERQRLREEAAAALAAGQGGSDADSEQGAGSDKKRKKMSMLVLKTPGPDRWGIGLPIYETPPPAINFAKEMIKAEAADKAVEVVLIIVGHQYNAFDVRDKKTGLAKIVDLNKRQALCSWVGFPHRDNWVDLKFIGAVEDTKAFGAAHIVWGPPPDKAAAASGEALEQKIKDLEQELAAMTFERDAWKKESRKFSAASKTATEALKGFSDRNVDRVVAAFVEDLKTGGAKKKKKTDTTEPASDDSPEAKTEADKTKGKGRTKVQARPSFTHEETYTLERRLLGVKEARPADGEGASVPGTKRLRLPPHRLTLSQASDLEGGKLESDKGDDSDSDQDADDTAAGAKGRA